MIIKVGFLIFAVSLAIAVHTSSLFLSSKEKSLAKQFKTKKQANSAIDNESKYAYTQLLIANVTRLLMLIGVVLVIVGYFLD
jgi:hypothetical protein